MSANNLVASKHAKHGISHAFSFTTRFLRIKEMIEEKINAGYKIQIADMIEAQLDTLDIQARISTEYIIRNIEKGLDSALNITYRSEI